MTNSILPIDLGGVNCYLVRAGDGFILVDTGTASLRGKLEQALAAAGVRPGNLKLILFTHGDVDHVENCVYIREKYGAPIAIHPADAGMVERGDMSVNRKAKPDYVAPVFGVMMLIMRYFGPRMDQFPCFKPDLLVEDGQSLAEYGCEALILNLPGHSKGSIGLLTADGGLICGDLFYNFPGLGMIDDRAAHQASVQRLKALPIQTLYPGHGKPCPAGKFVKA